MDNDEIIMIAVMGATGSGKSTFVRTATGNAMFEVGHGLRSQTAEVQESPAFPIIFQGHRRRCVLIDTPGFDDTTRSDSEVLNSIAAYLYKTYQKGRRLNGIIYLHRISDYRMGGISIRNFGLFRKLCGDDTLRSVAIVTNMWGEVPFERALARERELSEDRLFFRPAIEKGATMIRHQYNTWDSAQQILQFFLNKPVQTLQIERELVEEQMGIRETGAGQEVDRELQESQRRFREELSDIRKELEDTRSMRDAQARAQLEAARIEAKRKIEWAEEERQRMESDYEREKQRMDEELRAMRDRIASIQAQSSRYAEQQAQYVQQTQYAQPAHYHVEPAQVEEEHPHRRRGLFRTVLKVGAIALAVHTLGATAAIL